MASQSAVTEGISFGRKNFNAEERRTIQELLCKKLGQEHVATRPGQGGIKFSYVEGWKVVELASSIFGYDGWSSSIVDCSPDFIEQGKNGRFTVGATAIVRVMLKDGTYHEDVGFGIADNMPKKGLAIENAKKEAVTDARKRALRLFGNALGNCLYDKQHLKRIKLVDTDKSDLLGSNPATLVADHQRQARHNSAPAIKAEPEHRSTTAGPATNLTEQLPAPTLPQGRVLDQSAATASTGSAQNVLSTQNTSIQGAVSEHFITRSTETYHLPPALAPSQTTTPDCRSRVNAPSISQAGQSSNPQKQPGSWVSYQSVRRHQNHQRSQRIYIQQQQRTHQINGIQERRYSVHASRPQQPPAVPSKAQHAQVTNCENQQKRISQASSFQQNSSYAHQAAPGSMHGNPQLSGQPMNSAPQGPISPHPPSGKDAMPSSKPLYASATTTTPPAAATSNTATEGFSNVAPGPTSMVLHEPSQHKSSSAANSIHTLNPGTQPATTRIGDSTLTLMARPATR